MTPAPAFAQPVPYGPPKCAIGNPKTFCLDDPEYPAYEISAAIEYNYDAVQQMYKVSGRLSLILNLIV